jgi:DUF2911 family protein
MHMKSTMKLASLGLAIFTLAVFALPLSAQQDKSKRPSPPASASFTFPDGKTLKIDYSSPRMKGRKIYGALVPYGQVWRVGANEATTFVTDTDLMVGDKEVPAGSYTIFAIPEEGKWTLIISKKTGEWGIPYPGEQFDFARTPMQVQKLDSPMESFTITLVKAGDGCSMNFDWDVTRATIQINEKK